MNYNPYYFINPGEMMGSASSTSRLFGGINWGGILNGTQRFLGLINQALPIIKEAAPVMKNAKTMFKVMNEFKKMDAPSSSDASISNVKDTNIKEYSNYGGPTFFA